MIKFIKDYLFGPIDDVAQANIEQETKTQETASQKEPQKTYEKFINEYNGFKVGDTVCFVRIPLEFTAKASFYSCVSHAYLIDTITGKEINIFKSDMSRLGREFVISSIESFGKQDHFLFKAKNQNLELKFWNSDLDKDFICKKEDLLKYEKIIKAENDFRVEFKIRKLEGREDYSIWWRSINHPDYMEWVSILKNDHTKEGYKPYVFFSNVEAEEALEILKTRHPKTLCFFERKWKDI